MTPSELDRLADYAEGLLTGTPDDAAVAARIATDPEWADAYQQLTEATPAITAALGELADPPLPPAVAAALDRVLASEPPARPESALSSRARRTWGAGRASPAHVAKIGGWAAAAAVVTIAAVTAIVSTEVPNSDDSGASTVSEAGSGPSAARPDPSALSAAPAPAASTDVRVSGSRYTTADLGPRARALLAGTAADSTSAAESTTVPSGRAPAALSRLLGPAELAGCLAALGVGPSPLAVDYATLDGAPAVVVVTLGPGSTRLTVVAAGPGCGLDSAPDERARTTVER